MEIKFDAGKRLYTNAIRHRFVQGENLAESITITGPKQVGALDLSQLRMAVRVNSTTYETTVEKTLSQTVEGENISLEWVVDKMFTAVPGPVSVTLVGYGNEEEVIKITSDGILVKADDVNGTAPPESTWEQLLAEMQQFATETYKNAQAAAASEANAKASETAAAASAQEAQTSKTSAAASAEEAKNAAATAAQEAAEQAAAQAAAQTEAQIRSYADDRYARALKATAGPAEELTIYPDEGSSLQITVHGATVQAGSGDPSPVNVRALSGVGRKMVELVIDGGGTWTKFSGAYNLYFEREFSAPLPKAKISAEAQNEQVCTYCKIGNVDSTPPETLIYTRQVGGKTIVRFGAPSFTKVSDVQNFLNSTEVKLYYVPADESQASGWYTYAAVDGDTYAAAGLTLNGPLYDGDKVSNNEPSGCDKQITLDGSTYTFWNDSANSLVYLNLPDAAVGGAAYSTVFTGLSVTQGDSGPQLNIPYSGFPAGVTPGIYINVWLQSNPQPLWYQSTGYTAANDARAELETHGDILYTLTGEEVYTATGEGWAPGAVSISNFMVYAESVEGYASRASIICSHLATETPANVTNRGYQGCAQGGGTSLYLNFGDPYNTKELAVQYIKDQYAAGTPVQIKAKRATPIVYAHPAQPLIAAPDAEGKITVTGEGKVSATYNKSITRAIAELQAAALALGANLSI